jgi:glyoxylate utilization-related uncharacterized protein
MIYPQHRRGVAVPVFGSFGGGLAKTMVCAKGDQNKIISVPVQHMLESEGLMHIGGKDHLMHRHDYIFLPPGADHTISIAGAGRLVFPRGHIVDVG